MVAEIQDVEVKTSMGPPSPPPSLANLNTDHPIHEVRQFLECPDLEMELPTCQGIADARRFASGFGTDRYSVTVDAAGVGKLAHVVITKVGAALESAEHWKVCDDSRRHKPILSEYVTG